MEKLLNPYDKQYMKMAILKHEETFKEQVYELHRLYQVQKMLMRNIRSNRACRNERDKWDSANEFHLHEQQMMSRKHDLVRPNEGENDMVEIEDENEVELTLGLGLAPSRCQRRKKDETPLYTAEAGPSVSSSSTESSYFQRSSIKTQHRESITGQQQQQQQWGFIQVPSMQSYDIDEPLKQEKLNQPPWFFQVMNLNMA
ncbi:hypothetical protein ACHQM5_024986 [Ranunculus cassubicifolius]